MSEHQIQTALGEIDRRCLGTKMESRHMLNQKRTTQLDFALGSDCQRWDRSWDVLERLLSGETDYEALRPDVWRLSHPEAVRMYRDEERRDRADRKQFQRMQRRLQRQVELASEHTPSLTPEQKRNLDHARRLWKAT